MDQRIEELQAYSGDKGSRAPLSCKNYRTDEEDCRVVLTIRKTKKLETIKEILLLI